MSIHFPFSIQKSAFKSDLGLSSYRASFQSHLMKIMHSQHLTDEQWLIMVSNLLSEWFVMERSCFANHNRHLLTMLVKHGFIELPLIYEDL